MCIGSVGRCKRQSQRQIRRQSEGEDRIYQEIEQDKASEEKICGTSGDAGPSSVPVRSSDLKEVPAGMISKIYSIIAIIQCYIIYKT